ncbi:unnamed protein product [Closterium sp. NIES-53]
MASLSVLTFDHEGRPIQFDTWLDDIQLYLLSDSRDSVSLFDHTSGASLAPPTTADSATHSQWLTRNATACLADRNHLPLAERAHFEQHRTTKALYDAVVTRYSSPATAALDASESALLGTAPAEALHTFMLDTGASRCFFHDSTTLTPLYAPAPVRLADPSRGPVLARSSTVLPCPAVPFGSLSGLHHPSFSTNLVSTAALQDAMVTTTTPGGQRVSICTCTWMGRHLSTFTRRPGSSLYSLTTEPPQVAASAQVSASGLVAPPFSCRLLSHQTLLWHHRLGHPSLPRLRGMDSRLLVSSLPRSLPPLPPLPAPPCLPCVKGRQRAAPHSSSFPPTTTPLQTLHMDVWGPACVSGQGREHYFLLVVDDNTRYTTVFPLRSKGEVPDFFIPWIRAVRLQLRERFDTDLPILRLHSERGGELTSGLLRDFCRGEGILQSFTIPASPQQNGVAECCIGLGMEVARTSMIHAAAPHFLWPFAVRYAAHQLNLWPRVSLPETSPTLRWTEEVGDASVFQDVTFDESVPFYRLFSYRTAPLPPPPLFIAPAIESDAAGGGATRGAASGGSEPAGAGPGGTELACTKPGVVESEGAEPGGVEPEHTEPGGAELGGAEPDHAEPGGAEPGRTEHGGTLSTAGPPSALSRREPLSPPQLREWFARRTRLQSGAVGAGGSAARGTGAPGPGGTGAAGAGGAAGVGGGGTGARAAGGTGAAGPGGARARDPGAGDTEAGGAAPGGAGAVGAGSRETGRPRPFFSPLLQQVLGLRSSTGLTPPLICPPPDQSQPPLLPDSTQPPPSPYTEHSGGLKERREPESRSASPIRVVRIGRRVPRPRPPPVPGTHIMALRPSTVPLRVPCRLLRRPLLLTLLCLDYAASLVAESESDCPPSVRGECALGTDVFEDWQEAFECLADAVPHLVAMLLAPEGDPNAPDIPTPRSYAEAITVPPPVANIVDGMWIFRVKRSPGSPPAFKARSAARVFSQRQGVDFFQTFSPTPKITTLRVLLYVAA